MEKLPQWDEFAPKQEGSVHIHVEEMKSFFRSKYNIYQFLKELKQLYLPSYEETKICKW